MKPATPPPIAEFLASFRTPWKVGEVRPMAQAKLKPKRGRRPSPLVTVTEELRTWFEAEPSRSGGELLARFQATYPLRYADGLTRPRHLTMLHPPNSTKSYPVEVDCRAAGETQKTNCPR